MIAELSRDHRVRETELYEPVKAFLEARGYRIKGEVGNCDIVALGESGEVVIVELKTGFTLPLVLQGIQRQTMSADVYLAFAVGTGAGVWRRRRREVVKLCRMLGLGLMTVRMRGGGPARVEVHLDPGPYRPRQSKRRRVRLLVEFERRVGDPNRGGTSRRAVVTAYRQDALRCAVCLRGGAAKAADVKAATGVERAPRILQRDVYGWFERVARGTYALTPAGVRALDDYAEVLPALVEPASENEGGAK